MTTTEQTEPKTGRAKEPKPRRRRGEGSIAQEASGLYVARVTLPPDPITGKRRVKKVTSMNEKEIVKKLNALKRNLQDHGDLPTGSETVAKYMRYWHESVNRSRPTTRAGYRSSIEQHIIPAIGKIKLDKLTTDDVRKIEKSIIGKGLSSSTARIAHQVLAKALKDAEREGRVLYNVARRVDPPPIAATRLAELSIPDAVKVLQTVKDDRLASRWAAALVYGARQGEALGLEIDRVDFMRNEIDVSWQLQKIDYRHGKKCLPVGEYENGRKRYECGHNQARACPTRWLDAPANWEHRHLTGSLYLSRPKTSSGWRVIPLVEPFREILRQRVLVAQSEPNPFGLVWTSEPKHSIGGAKTRPLLPLDGSPIAPSTDNYAWHAALDRAGVQSVRLHDARHTAITLMYDLGIPETVIQDIVGQSVVAVTRKYRNKLPAHMQVALAQVGAVLFPTEAPLAIEQ